MNNHNNNIKYDFSNRIVLVTGGTGALGSSITKAFVESNATVKYLHTFMTKKTLDANGGGCARRHGEGCNRRRLYGLPPAH